MSEGLRNNPVGRKCYETVGRSTPCENCISRRAVFDGIPYEKEEIINGRVFSVMSSPVSNQKGEVIAVVEVLRDITQMKVLQKKISEQNRKLQYDLNIAKKLQCSLLPKDIPENKVDFSFIYKPCETLGGDFLDIYSIDEDHIGLYIADVSGHGVPASMLTVFLRSSINKKCLSPAQALNELFDSFNESYRKQDLYMTVFYAVVNTRDYSITYSNAGHNVCPIIFNTGKFEILRSAGIPISDWLETPRYQDRTIPLQKGDRIFFYTDGIIELRNLKNEQFGEKRLLDVLLNEPSAPGIVLGKILENACEFAGTSDFSEIADDITVALLEIK